MLFSQLMKRAEKITLGAAVKVKGAKEDVKRSTAARKMLEGDIEDWERDLNCIKEMRQKADAAVDLIGCHMLHDKEATPEVSSS